MNFHYIKAQEFAGKVLYIKKMGTHYHVINLKPELYNKKKFWLLKNLPTFLVS